MLCIAVKCSSTSCLQSSHSPPPASSCQNWSWWSSLGEIHLTQTEVLLKVDPELSNHNWVLVGKKFKTKHLRTCLNSKVLLVHNSRLFLLFLMPLLLKTTKRILTSKYASTHWRPWTHSSQVYLVVGKVVERKVNNEWGSHYQSGTIIYRHYYAQNNANTLNVYFLGIFLGGYFIFWGYFIFLGYFIFWGIAYSLAWQVPAVWQTWSPPSTK